MAVILFNVETFDNFSEKAEAFELQVDRLREQGHQLMAFSFKDKKTQYGSLYRETFHTKYSIPYINLSLLSTQNATQEDILNDVLCELDTIDRAGTAYFIEPQKNNLVSVQSVEYNNIKNPSSFSQKTTEQFSSLNEALEKIENLNWNIHWKTHKTGIIAFLSIPVSALIGSLLPLSIPAWLSAVLFGVGAFALVCILKMIQYYCYRPNEYDYQLAPSDEPPSDSRIDKQEIYEEEEKAQAGLEMQQRNGQESRQKTNLSQAPSSARASMLELNSPATKTHENDALLYDDVASDDGTHPVSSLVTANHASSTVPSVPLPIDQEDEQARSILNREWIHTQYGDQEGVNYHIFLKGLKKQLKKYPVLKDQASNVTGPIGAIKTKYNDEKLKFQELARLCGVTWFERSQRAWTREKWQDAIQSQESSEQKRPSAEKDSTAPEVNFADFGRKGMIVIVGNPEKINIDRHTTFADAVYYHLTKRSILDVTLPQSSITFTSPAGSRPNASSFFATALAGPDSSVTASLVGDEYTTPGFTHNNRIIIDE